MRNKVRGLGRSVLVDVVDSGRDEIDTVNAGLRHMPPFTNKNLEHMSSLSRNESGFLDRFFSVARRASHHRSPWPLGLLAFLQGFGLSTSGHLYAIAAHYIINAAHGPPQAEALAQECLRHSLSRWSFLRFRA